MRMLTSVSLIHLPAPCSTRPSCLASRIHRPPSVVHEPCKNRLRDVAVKGKCSGIDRSVRAVLPCTPSDLHYVQCGTNPCRPATSHPPAPAALWTPHSVSVRLQWPHRDGGWHAQVWQQIRAIQVLPSQHDVPCEENIWLPPQDGSSQLSLAVHSHRRGCRRGRRHRRRRRCGGRQGRRGRRWWRRGWRGPASKQTQPAQQRQISSHQHRDKNKKQPLGSMLEHYSFPPALFNRDVSDSLGGWQGWRHGR